MVVVAVVVVVVGGGRRWWSRSGKQEDRLSHEKGRELQPSDDIKEKRKIKIVGVKEISTLSLPLSLFIY